MILAILLQITSIPLTQDVTKASGGMMTWNFSDPHTGASYTLEAPLYVVHNGEVIYIPTPSVWFASAPNPVASNAVVPNNGACFLASGHSWCVVNGVVMRDGQKAGYSANVITLAFENGVVWQENASKLWWSWNEAKQAWNPGGVATSPIP